VGTITLDRVVSASATAAARRAAFHAKRAAEMAGLDAAAAREAASNAARSVYRDVELSEAIEAAVDAVERKLAPTSTTTAAAERANAAHDRWLADYKAKRAAIPADVRAKHDAMLDRIFG